MKKRHLFILLTLILTLSCLTACTGQAGAPPKKDDKSTTSKGTLNIAISMDSGINRMDAASFDGAMQVYPLVYDALVEYGQKGEIQPALAESWGISQDGKTYTFHLRHGVVFSDGTPFNAKAVKFSVDRWASKGNNDWLATANHLQKAEVIDEYTISLKFSERYFLTLAELSYARPLRMMSPTSVEPAGDPAGKFMKAIGTGAWVLDDYVKDVRTTFRANPNYWGGAPKVDKLVLKVIPDGQTRTLSLQNGDVDIAGGDLSKVPLESLPTFSNSTKTQVITQEGTSAYTIFFNTKANPALQDTKVRQAFNYAVDKEAIATQLFDDMGRPGKGVFADTNPYVTEQNSKGYAYDPTKAKSLLAEEGWTDTDGDGVVDKNGKPLQISMVLQTQDFPEWKALSETVQQQLFLVGIKLDLKVLESGAYYDALWKTKDYDTLIYHTYADVYNPLGFLTSFFYQTESTPAVAFGSKHLNELIDSVSTAVTEEERTAIYDGILTMLDQEAATVPLFYPSDVFVTNNRVSGFEAGPTTFRPILWNLLTLSDK